MKVFSSLSLFLSGKALSLIEISHCLNYNFTIRHSAGWEVTHLLLTQGPLFFIVSLGYNGPKLLVVSLSSPNTVLPSCIPLLQPWGLVQRSEKFITVLQFLEILPEVQLPVMPLHKYCRNSSMNAVGTQPSVARNLITAYCFNRFSMDFHGMDFHGVTNDGVIASHFRWMFLHIPIVTSLEIITTLAPYISGQFCHSYGDGSKIFQTTFIYKKYDAGLCYHNKTSK